MVGTIGVLFISVGEFLMLYSPSGGYGMAAGHSNFLYPSIERLRFGFYLAVLAVPAYILIYDHIAKMLNASKRLNYIIVALAVTGFTIGNIWLGTNAYIGFVVHQIAKGIPLQDTLIFLNSMGDPLLQIVRIIVLLLSAIVIWRVLQGGTFYPKWMIVCAPVLLIIYIFILYFFVPVIVIVKYLFPAALNFAHLFFMLLSTMYAFKMEEN